MSAARMLKRTRAPVAILFGRLILICVSVMTAAMLLSDWPGFRPDRHTPTRHSGAGAIMMTMHTAAIAAALVFGSSAVAWAQSSATSPPAAWNASDWTRGTSGPSTAPMSAVERDVRRKLESEGYDSITDLQQDKDGWMATARKGGKQVLLDIDNDGNVAVTK